VSVAQPRRVKVTRPRRFAPRDIHLSGENSVFGRSASQKRRVVLLDALRDHLGIIHGLADSGQYVPVAVDCGPNEHSRFSRKCGQESMPDWQWDEGSEQLLGLLPGPAKPVLFPLTIRAVEWTIRHRDQLASDWNVVPLPTADTFALANDKVRLAHFARCQGIAVPALVDLAEGNERDARLLGFPVLLKPRAGFGGSGIVRIEGPQALAEHLSGMTARRNYFVQSFISGRDMSCGVYCRNGEVLASIAYVPLARESRFGRFTSIEAIDDQRVMTVVGRLMQALRWNGIANVDLIQTNDGQVFVLEVNPRCWGNMAAASRLGVDFASLLCRVALDQPIARQQCRRGRVIDPPDALVLLRETICHGAFAARA
jgi:predicted ATP-grasp superfamily ATP-dependent carboligase